LQTLDTKFYGAPFIIFRVKGEDGRKKVATFTLFFHFLLFAKERIEMTDGRKTPA